MGLKKERKINWLKVIWMTSMYLFLILSNQLLKCSINLKSIFSSPCSNIIEHSAGASVRATRVERPIDEAMHIANCLNILPDIPSKNETGTNTAIRTSEVATTAPKTSFIVI